MHHGQIQTALTKLNLVPQYRDHAKKQLDEKPKAAIPALQMLTILAPTDAVNHYRLGEAYRKTEQYDQSIAAYDQAIKIDPKFVQAYCARGIIYLQTNALEKAEKDYLHAYQLNPKSEHVVYHLGLIYLKKGTHDKAAIHCFDKVLAINPKHEAALLELVKLYYKQQAWDFVIDYCEQLHLIDSAKFTITTIPEWEKSNQEQEKIKANQEDSNFSNQPEEETFYISNGPSKVESSLLDSAQTFYLSIFGTAPVVEPEVVTKVTIYHQPKAKPNDSNPPVAPENSSQLLAEAEQAYQTAINTTAEAKSEALCQAISLYKEVLRMGNTPAVHTKLAQAEEMLGNYYFDLKNQNHLAIRYFADALSHPNTQLLDHDVIIKNLIKLYCDKVSEINHQQHFPAAKEIYVKALNLALAAEAACNNESKFATRIYQSFDDGNLTVKQIWEIILELDEKWQSVLLIEILGKKNQLFKFFWEASTGKNDREQMAKNSLLIDVYNRLVVLHPTSYVVLKYNQNTLLEVNVQQRPSAKPTTTSPGIAEYLLSYQPNTL